MVNFGPIPPGLQVCHHCDVKLCVRPDHLFLGTNAENAKDMRDKGRGRNPPPPPRGEANHAAKLTEEQVREILARGYESTARELAAEFGVSHQLIGFIRQGRLWKHLATD